MNGLLRVALVVLIKAVILMPICVFCLWWAYSISASIDGGNLTKDIEVTLVLKMASLTTILVAMAWLLSYFLHRQQTWIKLVIKTSAESLLILALYTLAVLFWRNNWTPDKGMDAFAAFGPFVGDINARFFAEYGWLEYLICVAPIMALVSGALTPIFDFIQHRRQLKSRAS